jgi:hypothetical protein
MGPAENSGEKIMSEHAWTQDNLAAHVAGGLDAGERERLERHLAECFDCTSALENARAADRRLLALFQGVQPGPALEDRLIRSLRQGVTRKRVLPGMSGPWVKVVLATAAAALLAVVGAGISTLIEKDGLLAMVSPEREEAQSSNSMFGYTMHGPKIPKSIVLSDTSESMVAPGEGNQSPGGVGGGMMGMGGGMGGGVGLGTGTMASYDRAYKKMTYYELPAQGLSPEKLAEQLRAENTFGLLDGKDKLQNEFKSHLATEDGRRNATTLEAESSAKRSGAKVLAKEGSRDSFLYSPPQNAPPDGTTNKPVASSSPYLNTAPPTAGLGIPAPKAAVGVNTNGASGLGYFNKTPSSSTGIPKFWDDKASEEKAEKADKDKESTKETPAARLPGLEYFYRPDAAFTDLDREGKAGGVAKDVLVLGGAQKKGDKLADGERDLKRVTQDVKPPTKDQPAKPAAAPPAQPKQPEAAPIVQKIIIRSGEIEFVIDSFDSGVLIVQKLIAATKGGYVATINSDKLPNGKVFGSVVVRVPPDQLDKLVLDLRQQLGKIGELKGQRIGSRDITKDYTDLQSRLKAARTMEERLLNIIKSEKGAIKDLLMAEKELGIWRTKIEELTGELNYYANLVSLSTLTITMSEKELRIAASVSESERVQAGIEVEDVEKAMREVLKAVDDAKGRVTRSEMKQQSAGQFNAVLNFEVSPEASGPVRDRLKQLGTVTRFEVDRVQEAEGGEKLPMDGKLHRGNTRFFVSLYNLFSIAPRETVTVRLYVTTDVAAAYRVLREKVIAAKGRILDANLSEQDRQNVIAHMDFDVKRTDEAAIQAALTAAGELLGRKVTRAPAGTNVTDTKVLFRVDLIANVPARETVTMRLAAPDVAAAYAALREAVTKAKGGVINTHFNELDRTNVGAQIDFDVRRGDEAAIQAALATAGEVLSRTVVRLPESDKVTDSKVQFRVEFAGNVQPRDTVTVRLAALDVAVAYAKLREAVAKAKGRVVNANFDEKDLINASAQLDFDVRRSEEAAIQLALSGAGEVLSRTVARLPEGPNVTDTKMFFRVVFAGNVQPRETVTVTIAATDVAAAHRVLRNVVSQAKARILSSNLDEKDRTNVDANLDFDVRRTEEGAVQTALTEAGAVLSRFVARITSGENYTDARVLFKVKLVPANNIDPREVYALTVEVTDVEREMGILTAQVKEVQGRVVKGPTAAQERSGRVTARVVYDVPLVMAGTIVDKVKGTGTVRISEAAPNPQAPEGKLAIARIVVTLENAEVLVPRDDGLMAQVRSGLSITLRGLFLSVNFLIIALLFVVPWLLIIYALVWVVRRMWRPAVLAPAGMVPTEATAGPAAPQ